MEHLGLIVTLHRDSLRDLKDVVKKLRKHGLKIDSVTDYGVIMGSGSVRTKNKIRTEKEVESVVTDHYIQLPSPDSDIQ